VDAVPRAEREPGRRTGGRGAAFAAPRLAAVVTAVVVMITVGVFAGVAGQATLARIQRLDDSWLRLMGSGRSAPLTAVAKVFNLLGLVYVTLLVREHDSFFGRRELRHR
jgi:hypothetical protein